MYKHFIASSTLPTLMLCSVSAFAATPNDLSHSSSALLNQALRTNSSVHIVETNRSHGIKQSLHIRMQQTYLGYPVRGGEGILHINHATNTKQPLINMFTQANSMNGMLYTDIEKDLMNTPVYVFGMAQKEKALIHAIGDYQQKSGIKKNIEKKNSQLIVYVDSKNKAHWAYRINLYVPANHSMPAAPAYIIDALSFEVYLSWNEIETLDSVAAGGFGGNKKIGKLIYDDKPLHLAALDVERDAATKTCYMQNHYAGIHNFSLGGLIQTFGCEKQNPEFNNLYWDGERDAINGSYSTSHDALYAAKMVNAMHQERYHASVWEQRDGKQMPVYISVHVPDADAYYYADPVTDESRIYIGDSIYDNTFYPLSSFGTVAHEMHHGFTYQHSKLEYVNQSGGLNEAFSDMASQAAEFYVNKKCSWQIGFADMRDDVPFRYLDEPSKDCIGGKVPGTSCSMNHMKQYFDNGDVHYSSGIPNRAFYLMSTAPGWNPAKAFDIMRYANMHYWTATTTYAQAACGVIKAAEDYKYEADVVKNAFMAVGIDTSHC